ncbi:MAG: metal-dependent hydrolase [Actinobacteria bacterium]|nr:metal-dependent hydrolase [Actinomycetota bacterium]
MSIATISDDLTSDDAQTLDPDRTIIVRRVDFADMLAGLTKDFTRDGDVISSHVLSVLSGLFPDGEEMFIESVRHFRDRVTDADLKRQVNAFIGQEVIHGRQHRELNARFAELGYRSKIVEQFMQFDEAGMTPGMQFVLNIASRVGPLRTMLAESEQRRAERGEDAGPDPMFELALTAALEHYTATMAELLLTEADLQDLFADEDLFRMWAWHAIEESEHRAVAFDVFRAAGGDEEMRLRAMKLAGWALVFIAGWHVTIGAVTDRRSWRRFGLPRSLWRLRKNPLLGATFRRRLAEYYRPGFHPLQRDTSALEDRWRSWFDDEAPRPTAAESLALLDF